MPDKDKLFHCPYHSISTRLLFPCQEVFFYFLKFPLTPIECVILSSLVSSCFDVAIFPSNCGEIKANLYSSKNKFSIPYPFPPIPFPDRTRLILTRFVKFSSTCPLRIRDPRGLGLPPATGGAPSTKSYQFRGNYSPLTSKSPLSEIDGGDGGRLFGVMGAGHLTNSDLNNMI